MSQHCYLCSGVSLRPRKGTVRDMPSLKVLECDNCGLVFLSSHDHLGANHYQESRMHGPTPPTMESWLRETERDDQRRLDMLQTLIVNRRVLDFGCGAGGFVQKAVPLVADIAGVEPELRVAEFWSGKLKIRPDIEQASEGMTYDVITAFHVLEHLPDPRGMLRKLAKHLAPGGQIVVEVPNSDDALLTLYACEEFQNFTYWSQHLFLFNAANLTNLAVDCGLRVVSVQHVQRYPLSNHLYWLSHGGQGGHRAWGFLDGMVLTGAYSAALAAIGKTDTIVGHFERACEGKHK